MSKDPLVSIITINYNQAPVTAELLKSLKNISYKNIEVIVVDNASKDDPTDIVSSGFPGVKIILSKQNLGFAGGNNLGIKQAKGKYILLLNNDTEVDPNFLEPLVIQMENKSTTGVACPKITYYNTDIIQYAGSFSINPYTGRGKKIGNKEIDKGQYNTTKKTELGHGAAFMISREVIQKIGLMPEIFFLYYEEHDWAESVKRAGYDIYYVGNSCVYHKESMSVGKNNPAKTYYMSRNRLIYMRRNVFGIKKLISLLFFVCFAVPNNIFKFLIKGNINHLIAFIKGLLWNLTHLEVQDKQNSHLIEKDLIFYTIKNSSTI